MSNSHLNVSGLCRISEDDSFLAEFNGHSVTSLNPNTSWRLSHPVSSSPNLIFTLVPAEPGVGLLVDGEWRIGLVAADEPHVVPVVADESSVVPLVLTLGKKGWFQQRIGMFVEPLMTPVPKSQLWTLQDVVATERVPMRLTARIQSAQYTHLSACEGIVGVALPMLYQKVGAGPKPLLEGRKWTFDYFAEEE